MVFRHRSLEYYNSLLDILALLKPFFSRVLEATFTQQAFLERGEGLFFLIGDGGAISRFPIQEPQS